MGTLQHPHDRIADLEAEVEHLRGKLDAILGYFRLLGASQEPGREQAPYERAAASTRPLSVRLAAAGFSVVGNGE